MSVFLAASAKRIELLKSIIAEIKDAGYGNDEHRKTKLKAFCETRWVERHASVLKLLTICYCL